MIKEELNNLLQKYNLSPNKIRGQNFLISEMVLDTIIKTAAINKEELILEIGPGLGSLTERLVKDSKKVIALEIDQDFQKVLNKLEKKYSNLEIIWQDILSLTNEQLRKILSVARLKDYKVVANIPYYLTSKLINKFLAFKKQPLSMTIMVQKEVAQRLAAEEQSLLSLSLSFYAQVEIITIVSKEKFFPSPQVDSALIHINNIHPWLYTEEENELWKLIHKGFAHKRKKLINNLKKDSIFKKEQLIKIFKDLNLDKNIRAQDLSKENWLALFKKIS